MPNKGQKPYLLVLVNSDIRYFTVSPRVAYIFLYIMNGDNVISTSVPGTRR